MAGKREPTDHFEKQKSPEYFEMTFRCTCFRLLYVFVSDITVYWKRNN